MGLLPRAVFKVYGAPQHWPQLQQTLITALPKARLGASSFKVTISSQHQPIHHRLQ